MSLGKLPNGLETWTDRSGQVRVLARLPLSPRGRMMRAGRQTFTSYLKSKGLSLIPRDQWKPIDRRTVLGNEFINNQKSSSGCVGWSGAQAFMRARALRGMTFQKLSGAFIYAHINGGFDGGAMITDAMDALEKYGTCLESQFNYPQIYARQIPSEATATANDYKLTLALTLSSFDEIGTALQMGYIPQFPINVGFNFENFDSDGVAGSSRGGNHSVHADGMKQRANGRDWILDMPNSWDLVFGPFKNGRCYLDESAIRGSESGGDAYVHIDEAWLDTDPLKPPAPAA